MTKLATTLWGSGPRLVICHGFTQTSSSWGAFGRALSSHHTIVAVDLPGHGGSSDIEADVVGAAHDLLDTVGEEPFVLLGYSMGARVAMTAAMMQPRGLRELILIGGTPGILDDEAREQRRVGDEALASELEETEDVGGFLDRWLAQPLFAGLSDDAQDRASRMKNSARGLAMSLRKMGTGTQQSAWGFLDLIDVPTLLLVGELDPKFVSIAHGMHDELSISTLAIAPGVGHACHLEAPEPCVSVIEHWLDALHGSASPTANTTPTAN